jgi:hypothetical protein
VTGLIRAKQLVHRDRQPHHAKPSSQPVEPTVFVRKEEELYMDTSVGRHRDARDARGRGRSAAAEPGAALTLEMRGTGRVLDVWRWKQDGKGREARCRVGTRAKWTAAGMPVHGRT